MDFDVFISYAINGSHRSGCLYLEFCLFGNGAFTMKYWEGACCSNFKPSEAQARSSDIKSGLPKFVVWLLLLCEDSGFQRF